MIEKDLIKLLTSEEGTTASMKEYAEEKLPEYLIELRERDGCILDGILVAIETYLEK